MKENWRISDFYIGEDDFEDKINKLQKDLSDIFEEGYLETTPGVKIHYYLGINPDAKASIVISHGFCEFFPKYYEIAWNLFRAGYSVFFCEHRGHGFSSREDLDDVSKVYVKSFDDYVSDFHTFVEKVVKHRMNTEKLILLAHSMGGCIGTLVLEAYPNDFDGAVLSSPMIKMAIKGHTLWFTKLVLNITKFLPWDKKYAPGQRAFNPGDWFSASSMSSKARFWYVQHMREAHDEYKTFGGTYGWTRAAVKATEKVTKKLGSIKIPVLMLEAGKDTMVDNEGHRQFEQLVPQTETVIFPDSKHEIFNSTDENRQGFYVAIFEWLERVL